MTAQDAARYALLLFGACGLGWAVYHIVTVAAKTRRDRIARRARAFFDDARQSDESPRLL